MKNEELIEMLLWHIKGVTGSLNYYAKKHNSKEIELIAKNLLDIYTEYKSLYNETNRT